jgi:hypothetical protein
MRWGFVLCAAFLGCARGVQSQSTSAFHAGGTESPPWPEPGPRSFDAGKFEPSPTSWGDQPDPPSPDQTWATVHAHVMAVRRRCWDLLDAGPSSSSTTVHLSVDDSGHVSSAQADGDNDAVARCLENEVKSWTFPQGGGATQLSIPYKFFRH